MQSVHLIRNISILLAGLLWIGLSAENGDTMPNDDISAPQKGFFAPDFTLASMDGKEVTLSKLRGHVLVLNIWASWCLPCRKEMPTFIAIFHEYENRGVLILAVNSTSQDSFAAVEAFVSEYHLPFTILMDYDGFVARQYKLSALPTTYFIGQDGVISRVVIGGPLSETTLRSELETLLSEEKP